MTFKSCNPFTAAVYFMGMLLVSMFVAHPIMLVISFMGALAFCLFILRIGEFLAELRFCLILSVFITILNPFISHNGVTILYYFNDNPVTLEAYLYGAGIGLMVSTVFLWCKALSTVFTADRTVYLFGKFTPKTAIVLTVALRFIPMLKKQSKRIRHAQKLNGLTASDGYFDRIKALLQMFSGLIGWSLENAVETANAMRAKGYAARKRTFYSDFFFLASDILLIAAFVLLFGWVFFASSRHETDFSYYPALNMSKLSFIGISAMIIFAFLAFLPAIIEVKERVKWKRLKSKI